MRDRKSWKTERRQARYRAIEAENARQVQCHVPLRPTIVVPRAEDRRDPIEIARAANAALHGGSI